MSIDINNVKPGDSVRFASTFWINPTHYGYSWDQWVRVLEVPGDGTLTIEPAAEVPADEKHPLEHNVGFGLTWFDDHRPADQLRVGLRVRTAEEWDALPMGTVTVGEDGWTYVKIADAGEWKEATATAYYPDGERVGDFYQPWYQSISVQSLPAEPVPVPAPGDSLIDSREAWLTLPIGTELIDADGWTYTKLREVGDGDLPTAFARGTMFDRHGAGAFYDPWEEPGLRVTKLPGSATAGTEPSTAEEAPADQLAERAAELGGIEDQLDIALDVLGYALDRLDPADRQRVLGYWDARLTD